MVRDIHIQPTDPETARTEIERTRARMSHTLDEIEGVLVRKKAEIRERLDVVARIRQKPIHAAGIVLGAGILLGFLSGGRKRDPRLERERADAEERAARWESRARRLLAIAREQEGDVDDMETVVGGLLASRYRGADVFQSVDEDDDDLGDDLDEADVDDDLDEHDEDGRAWYRRGRHSAVAADHYDDDLDGYEEDDDDSIESYGDHGRVEKVFPPAPPREPSRWSAVRDFVGEQVAELTSAVLRELSKDGHGRR